MHGLMPDFFARLEDYLLAGGPLMVPLALVSLAMWTLIIHRALFLRKLYQKNMPRSQALACLQENTPPDPRRYRGAVALLVNDFLQRRSHNLSLDRYILDESVLVLNASMDRQLALIGALAAMAPLIGLLGTVTGMIATFDVISAFGTGNAKAMAGGISEALITTQTGLLVAIPGLYMKGFLSRRAETLKQRIASVGIYLRRQL